MIEFDSEVSQRAEKIKFHSSQQVSKKKDWSLQMVLFVKFVKNLFMNICTQIGLLILKSKEPKELKDAIKDYLKVCKDMI